MTPTKNRRPGANWHGGEQIRKDLGKSNVISLASVRKPTTLDGLTVTVALARLKAGTFEPALLEILLEGVGICR